MSKYENKFAKLQKKAAEFNFRNQLKVVKKKEFTLEEEDKEVRKEKLYSSLLHKFFSESFRIVYDCSNAKVLLNLLKIYDRIWIVMIGKVYMDMYVSMWHDKSICCLQSILCPI